IFFFKPKSKISASRKLSLKILLLQRAMEELEQETVSRDEDKVKYLSEKLPPLQITGLSMDELQVMSSEVGDWRKNVEAMSGMEGRKKMFDAAGGGQ
uniref:Troponin I, skeletal, slow c n=1 Tax=Sinocyclocheilus grahami TaxID=75366 RepID=A0A672PWV6_SINGR